MTLSKYTKFEKFLLGFALVLVLIGILVLVVFLLKLKVRYSINSKNGILLTETGQVGDFIGGLVGSIWTLASVVLFYLAIRLQTKELAQSIAELKVQTNALKDQKQEFEINRLTNIIFQQISRIDSFVEKFEITYRTGDVFNRIEKTYIGFNALQSLLDNLPIENYDNSIQDQAALMRSMDLINKHYDKILSLVDVYVSSTVAVERILDSSLLVKKRRNELKVLFNDNIGIVGNRILERLGFIIKIAKEQNKQFQINSTEIMYLSGILHTYLSSNKKYY